MCCPKRRSPSSSWLMLLLSVPLLCLCHEWPFWFRVLHNQPTFHSLWQRTSRNVVHFPPSAILIMWSSCFLFTVRNNFSVFLSSIILMHPTGFLNIKTAQNVRLYLLTPWSRALLENLTGSKLINKFPTFYRIRRFITGFTCARYLSLTWAKSIQPMPYPHPSSWRSIFLFYKKNYIYIHTYIYIYIYNSLFLQCPLESHLMFCTPTKSNFYPASSLATAVSETDL